MTSVSVHQPNFMCWLKLLDKVLASDVFVAYDTVQYTRGEYHGRQKIRQSGGTGTSTGWLTVPVPNNKGSRRLIQDVRIDNEQPFRAEHLEKISRSYRKTSYFDEVFPIVEEVYRRDQVMLADLSLDLIEAFCRYLGNPVRIVRASELPHDRDADKNARLIDLTLAAGGDTHLTSTYGTAEDYLELDRFTEAGLALRAQVFEHPRYDQPHGDFVPHLAALDALFVLGRGTGELLAERRELIDLLPARSGAN